MDHSGYSSNSHNRGCSYAGKLSIFLFSFFMLSDGLLTVIGYHYFDYTNYNPYTIWIFRNLHWSIWILAKIMIIFLVYAFIRKTHWAVHIPLTILITSIMLGAVLYDWDSIFNTSVYQRYLLLFEPLLSLPFISKINNLLWGLYA